MTGLDTRIYSSMEALRDPNNPVTCMKNEKAQHNKKLLTHEMIPLVIYPYWLYPCKIKKVVTK